MLTSYNRYSHHARRALSHAGGLALRYRHPRIDTGHLLVGILLTEGSIGCAVLKELGLRPDEASPHLQLLTMSLTNVPENVVNDAALDAALDLAADESIWLGHHYVGTEHLILGMTRTNVGNAGDLLRRMNVSPEQVRRRVRRALNDGLTEYALELARRAARFSELSRRVLAAAEQISVLLDHETVGLGHLLAAIIYEKRGTAPNLLRASQFRFAQLQHDLDARSAPLLISIETVLDRASELAQTYSSHYVGTEHLLLALTLDPVSAAVLDQYGVKAAALKAAVETQLRESR
jgi:ATP-dependent Clp protease ATP-binding subunit ClpA